MPIVRKSSADFDPATIDWARIDATTDEDIARQIAEDADTAPEIADLDHWRLVPPDSCRAVTELRDRLGLSREMFADRFHLPRDLVRDWEEGRTIPDEPALVLLRVIGAEPDAVTRALKIEHAA